MQIASVTEWRHFLLALDLVKQIINDQTSKVQLFTEFITDKVHDVSSYKILGKRQNKRQRLKEHKRKRKDSISSVL